MRMAAAERSRPNSAAASPVISVSAHRCGGLVNSCRAVAPISAARPGASSTPPAVETCAPSGGSRVPAAPRVGSAIGEG
jgi:hypothetical protein